MQHTPLPSDTLTLAGAGAKRRFIYVACPWSPAGGGMYKVADYMVQSQAAQQPEGAAQLRPLESRGPGSAIASAGWLAVAIGRIVRGRLAGTLAGLHVNCAERLSFARKGSLVLAARALGVPVVLHLHAQFRNFYLSLPAPARALVRFTFRAATGVVVIGEQPRRFVTEELGVPAQRVEIVHNGVPGPAEAPVRERNADAPLTMLFVGRLCEPKGVSDLLRARAAAKLQPGRTRLVFAGSGDIEGYRKLAAELGIAEEVEFAGWCDQAKVNALLHEADLLVLPSHDEVMPLVVLEAMGHGVPVLCTPVGELPNVLRHGSTGWFTPAQDVEQLARALETLATDAATREQLGRNGRALYEQQFSLRRFFGNIARLHQRWFGIAARPAEPGSGAHHD